MLDPKVKVSRRIVRPGLRLRHYGGGDIRSDGQVPMVTDLDFNSVGLPKNLPAPTLDGHAARKKYVDDAIAAATGILGSKTAGRMSRSTDQAQGAGGDFCSFTTEDFDYGNMVDIAGHPTRLTCPQAGIYQFFFEGETAAIITCVVYLYKNGNPIQRITVSWAASTYGAAGPNPVVAFIPEVCAANDYFEIRTNDANNTGAMTWKGSVTPFVFSGILSASNASGGGDLRSDGTVAMTAAFDNGGFISKNLPAPVADNDAARKKYVDDAIAAVVASIAASPYKKIVARKTNGNVGLGALADIAGLTVTFTALGGECEVKFSAAFATNAVVSITVVIDIDGGTVTKSYQVLSCVVGAGSDSFSAIMGTIVCPVNLSAGAHTIKIRAAGVNATLIATDAAHPASLVVDYQ